MKRVYRKLRRAHAAYQRAVRAKSLAQGLPVSYLVAGEHGRRACRLCGKVKRLVAALGRYDRPCDRRAPGAEESDG